MFNLLLALLLIIGIDLQAGGALGGLNDKEKIEIFLSTLTGILPVDGLTFPAG